MALSRFAHSLGFKLFLILFSTLLIIFIIFTYVIIKTHTFQLMKGVEEYAKNSSDIIKRSTRYSMLLNRREDVYQIIKTIGDETGVDGIRIYNKRGEIMFSTDSTEIKKMVDLNAEACIICHAKGKPLETPKVEDRKRIFQSPNGNRVMGLIHPIRNEPDCYTADCHFHSKNQTILGVLDVRMSLNTVEKQINDSREIMMAIASAAILFISILLGWFIWRVVQTPVHKLILGTQELARGNLDYTLNIESQDEIGQLANSFNYMTQEMKKARDEITSWSLTLENKVKDKTDELKKAQHHLIQIEKMASLGKLSATVAHELNNPLGGILTYTKLIIRRLSKEDLNKEDIALMVKDLNFMASEINRCGNIVRNLLVFSKKNIVDYSVESLHDIVERSHQLVRHHLEIKNIKMEINLCTPPCTILCNGQSIQQAFIALFVNAVEAMPQGGTITISSQCFHDTDTVEIRVSDTGFGIRPEDLPSIFEPFFTTKQDGKGVGLGLSVVYGIIEQHNGEIKVQSKVGEGTTFIITLPNNLSKTVDAKV